MASANIASAVMPGKFDPNKDKWENYREQLFFALEAAGPLQSVQKRALFLSQCGKEAFALIVSLLAPRKSSEVSFEEIVEILNKFFVPTPHPILETEKFYKRKQKPNESVTNFVAALRDISSRCQFNVDLERRIVEQLILGAREEGLRKELLKIKVNEMTFDVVVQQALNYESIQQNNQTDGNNLLSRTHCDVAPSSMSRGEGEPMEVNAVNTRFNSTNESKEVAKCVHCAKSHSGRCRFRNATCYKCHKKGHTKAVCDVNKQKSRLNFCCHCEGADEEAENNTEDSFGVHEVSGAGRVKPFMVEVTVNGIPLVMEVDSGSARSILPHSVYRQHQSVFREPLTPCNSKLVTWTNDELKIRGETMVNVTYKEKSSKLPLIVSCGKGPALLGRAWFDALGISVHGINSVDERSTDYSERFPQLFSGELDKYSGPLVQIDCKKDASPVFLRSRPVPFPLREKVNAELKRMMADEIITPVKHSQWATPLRIVPKSDGSLRLCGDYRSTVNAVCLADSYPLPTANEGFFSLAEGKIFTKLDLKHAYNQLKVTEATAELLTLNTPLGLMKMNRLAYGVNAATGIFQRLMCSILSGIDGVACLLDDVVVSGCTIEQHDKRLMSVLKRLDEVGLKLNKSKCVFAAKRVTFLGYEIDEAGIHPSKDKVKEISEKPAPKNKRELKAFLGLYNFYERFLKDKTVVLEPLYKLLKENVKWQWSTVQQKAFDNAKALLTCDMTLVHYSLERELMMICDASEVGVGAVLVHKMEDGTERPVIMSSRTLQPHERRYAQIDKEALAIMFGLKKFRQYLLGRNFMILTDHKPLLGIFGRDKSIPELVSPRMLRWALTLNTFDYKLQYRPGKQMGDADSLSRWPTPCTEEDIEEENDVFLLEQTDSLGVTSKKIAKETEKDQVLKKVKMYLLHGWPNTVDPELIPFQRRKDCLSLSKDCVLWANRVVIPQSLQRHILKRLHEGHSGIVQTKMMARAYLWYPALDTDIEKMVGDCEQCLLNRNNPPATEHSWPGATRPWSRVHIDFMGPFMGKTFLVVVDAYSKWPVVRIMPAMTSKAVIDALRDIFADNGLPDSIVSDNGLAFTSTEFQEFIDRNYIKHVTGAPYHPSTNGQAERMIQTIKSKLKKQSNAPWLERVARMLFHMRTTPSTVTGKTPAEMLNGRKFRTALTVLHPELDAANTGTDIEDRTAEKEGGEINKKRFNVGDHVLFRLYNMNNKWQRACVTAVLAPALYEVTTDGGVRHRRHVDQMLRTRPPVNETQRHQEYEGDENDPDIIIPPPEEWSDILGM